MAIKKRTKPRTASRKKGSDRRTVRKAAQAKKLRLSGFSKKTLAGRKPKRKILKPPIKRRIKVKTKKKVRTPVSDGVHKTKIRVIGIGGGGSSIVSEIVSRVKRTDFVVANTDARALKESARAAKKFQFGQSLTHGLGTGMNVELGEKAAQEKKEKIKKLFEGQDLCIIITCLGGGTGSGATPVFAKISKNLNCLTYGIFTLPFEFEGEKKMELAKEALQKIRPYLDAYSFIPNERIFRVVDKDTPLKDALSAINKKLAESLEGLIEMIYLSGLINIDFADMRTVFKGQGKLAYLNTVEIEGVKGEEVIKKVISSPLYPYTIKGAKGILYDISGDKVLQLSEVSQISKVISELVNKNAKIIFGISQNKKYQNKIKITLLGTGCQVKGFLVKPSQIIKSKPGKGIGPKVISGIKKDKVSLSKKVKGAAKTPIFLRKAEVKNKKAKRKVVQSNVGLAGKISAARAQKPILKTRKPLILKKKDVSRQKTISEVEKKPKIETKPKPPVISKSQTLLSGEVKSEAKKSLKLLIPASSQLPVKPEDSVKEKIVSTPNRILQNIPGEKIRRNGLELKRVAEAEEKEILEKEKIWETPAIFRKKDEHGN